jgi:hypothetical protein
MTHALLIGVSVYDHVRSLGAGAHTAVRIFEWLINADQNGSLPARLGTVMLLLSPTEAEKAIVNAVVGEGGWAPATGGNIRAARSRLRTLVLDSEQQLKAPDDLIGAGLAIYYFGGHGTDFFREDPVGLGSDADDRIRPWPGAFDQKEFREHLTRIETDGRPVGPVHRARCVFLYDCCRLRDGGADFAGDIELQYDARRLLEQPAGIRPYVSMWAASESFPAWEPKNAIRLSPVHDLPLSYFGQALMNALGWSQDESTLPNLPWQTSAFGLQVDVHRAMKELARYDGGEEIPGSPEMKCNGDDFSLRRSPYPPGIGVSLRCDPVTLRDRMNIGVYQQFGTIRQSKKSLPPWTNHPESCIFVPGMFVVKAKPRPGTPLEKIIKLRPAIDTWKWIVRDDEIAVHDPAD